MYSSQGLGSRHNRLDTYSTSPQRLREGSVIPRLFWFIIFLTFPSNAFATASSSFSTFTTLIIEARDVSISTHVGLLSFNGFSIYLDQADIPLAVKIPGDLDEVRIERMAVQKALSDAKRMSHSTRTTRVFLLAGGEGGSLFLALGVSCPTHTG
jgi:hypothetical protein